MKLNNKGYMLIEIVMAAAIAIGIATIIAILVVKLKNKNDDSLVNSYTTTDITIVSNKIMKYAIEHKSKFKCYGEDGLRLKNNTLMYGDDVLDIFNEYATLGELNCSVGNGKVSVFLPIDIPQMPDKDYSISVSYKYNVDNLIYPYVKVEANEPTTYEKEKSAKIIIGSEFGLKKNNYRIKYQWSLKKISCNQISDDNSVTISVDEGSKENEAEISVGEGTGKGIIYACNIDPLIDVTGNELPETITYGVAYLDNTPPECDLSHDTYGVFFSKNQDAHSGTLDYGINLKKDTPIYDKATSDDRTKQARYGCGKNYYGYVRDILGNEAMCVRNWSCPPPEGSEGDCTGAGCHLSCTHGDASCNWY